MRINLTAVLAVFLLVALFPAAPAGAEEPEGNASKPADPIVGEWHLLTQFRGQEMTSRITITRAGDGTLSGTYRDSSGSTSELSEVVFSDGTLTFKRTAGTRSIRFSGTISGETIRGFHRIASRKIATQGMRGEQAFHELVAQLRQANMRGKDLEVDYEKHKRRAAPRDAFPVLFNPEMTPAAEAKGIRDDEPIIGVFLGGEAQAYPISIMGVHELVNASCGGQPIAASW